MGAMWHASGANTTLDQHRMELNLAYIPFWLNHTAGGWPPVHPETFQRMPRLLQELNQHRVTVPFIISGVDANGDEQIYIFDLVLVASQFGQSGADLIGDVNSDGVVNIFDLVAITGAFGQSNLGVALGI